MPGPDGKSHLEDLLADDRVHLRQMTEERVASGMFDRVAGNYRRRNRSLVVFRLAVAIALAAAGMIAVLRIDRQHKPLPPEAAKNGRREMEVQKTPAPRTSPMVVRSPKSVRRQPGASSVAAHRVMPRQPVFPGNSEPTEQERLMMALARSDLTREDKQMSEISRDISAQIEREKGQRQAFEKWLQEGGAGR